MILIGENLNVMSQTLGPAMRERNAGPLEEMAKAETEAGIDLIDLNVGPARRGGDELMSFVVNTVQGVTDKMLSLDTTNLDAMEAGLKVKKSNVLMNSVSLRPGLIIRCLMPELKCRDWPALSWFWLSPTTMSSRPLST